MREQTQRYLIKDNRHFKNQEVSLNEVIAIIQTLREGEVLEVKPIYC